MAEIEKIAVYDARIIQDPPKYAVQKGALSVSTSQFQANAANSSQISFQVLVPSLNVFTDRKIELNASAYVYAEAVPSQVVQQVGAITTPIAVPAGVYIQPPGTASQCYNLQDHPIPATFPPDGQNFQSGNTACVLPANSWPGLTGSAASGIGRPDPLPAFRYDFTAPDETQAFLLSPGVLLPYKPNPYKSVASIDGTFQVNIDLNAYQSDQTANPPGTVLANGSLFPAATPVVSSPAAAIQSCTHQNVTFELIDNATPPIVYGTTRITGVAYNSDADPYGDGPSVNFSGSWSVPLTIDRSVDITKADQLTWRLQTPDNTSFLPVDGVQAKCESYTIDLKGVELLQTAGGSTDNYYQSIGAPSDLSLGMFPLQTLATTMTATINDCSVSVTGDVLHEQLLLSQTRASLMQRTCASKFDVYAWSADDTHAANGSFQAYDEARDSDIPNGSSVITFVNPSTGLEFKQFDAYQYTLPSSGTVVTVPVINYRPAFIPFGSNLVGQTIPSSTITGGYVLKPTDATVPLPIMFRFQSTEPMCLSPFLWQDSKQMSEVGLYGITNMTINMTLASPGAVVGYDRGTIGQTVGSIARLYMDKLSNSFGSYNYMTRQSGINALFGNMRLQPPTANAGNQTGPWVTPPRLFCTFLTPPPEITLPLVSSVPYVEFPRYNSSATAAWGSTGTVTVQSATVTLSSIPDLLVVFVKPAYRGQTQCDTYIPISNIGVTFDNYANLCSNFSQEDLYASAVAGGLDMDWNQFRGFARGKTPTLTPFSSGVQGQLFDTYKATSGNVQLTGAPIILRMGQDIPLSSGLAPGTLGNYSVQVNLTLDNSNGFFNYLNTGGLPPANNVIITIMGVNSGFFESVRGSSALRKTILNTNDVEAASTSSSVTSSQLVRLVGGAAGMHTSSRLTTSLGMPQFKPAVGDDSRIRKMPRTQGSYIP